MESAHDQGAVGKSLTWVLRDYWVLIVLASVVIYGFLTRYGTPLRKVPGPFWGSITRLWRVSMILRQRQELVMIDLHKKYGRSWILRRCSGFLICSTGPVVRTGPQEVSISDPAAFKVIYSAGSKFRKPKYV